MFESSNPNNYPALQCWLIDTEQRHCDGFLYKHGMEHDIREVTPTKTGFLLRGLNTREIYTLDNERVFGPGPGIAIDVTSIKRLLGRRQVPFKMMRVDLDQRWVDYTYQTGGCEEHGIERLKPEDCTRPGIMIMWRPGATTMIDGNHRLVRTWREGCKTFEMAMVQAVDIIQHVCRQGAEEQLFNNAID